MASDAKDSGKLFADVRSSEDIPSISGQELNLSKSEKEKLINKEFAELRTRCAAAGLDDAAVRKQATPFLHCRRLGDRKRMLSKVLVYSLLVSAMCGTLYFNVTYDWVTAHARLAAIRMIPYYDYTQHYNDLCLVTNPLYKEQEKEKSCENCMDMGDVIETLPAATTRSSTVMSDYLDSVVPVVITGGIGDWPAVKNNLTIAGLRQMYQDSSVLMENFRRQHQCVILGPSSEIEDALAAMEKAETIDSHTVLWQHCHMKAYKEFRKLYRRPSFIPPAAEASQYNAVLTAFGNQQRTDDMDALSVTLLNRGGDMALWVGQVTGELHYTIAPVAECSKCSTYEVFLSPGDFMLVPLDIWDVSFRPVAAGAPEAIAFASGLTWDSY